MDERLRPEDLPDRRRKRRRADLGADPRELLEHLVEAVARRLQAEVRVDRGDEPRGQVVLGGTDGDARSERRHRLVADQLVDELRRVPQAPDVDLGVHPEARQRLRERLAGDAVDRERDGVHRACGQVCAGADPLQRRREGVPAGALAVEADRELRGLCEPRHELRRAVRAE